jgi:hypothetical protein
MFQLLIKSSDNRTLLVPEHLSMFLAVIHHMLRKVDEQIFHKMFVEVKVLGMR